MNVFWWQVNPKKFRRKDNILELHNCFSKVYSHVKKEYNVWKPDKTGDKFEVEPHLLGQLLFIDQLGMAAFVNGRTAESKRDGEARSQFGWLIEKLDLDEKCWKVAEDAIEVAKEQYGSNLDAWIGRQPQEGSKTAASIRPVVFRWLDGSMKKYCDCEQFGKEFQEINSYG